MVYERLDSWYLDDVMTKGVGARVQTLVAVSWPEDSVA